MTPGYPADIGATPALLAGTDLPGSLWSLPSAGRMVAAISAHAHAGVLNGLSAEQPPRDRPRRA